MNKQEKRDRLERDGWEVVTLMNGRGYIATKGTRTMKAATINSLHKQIKGY